MNVRVLVILEGEVDDETANHATSFSGSEDSCDEEVSYEELADSHKKPYAKSEEICLEGEEQKKIIARLQIEKGKLLSTIPDLKDEVTLLTSKLDNMTKCVRMLNNGSDMLE
ncbi:gag-protease polyprotein [Trifolium medium]|uniref:Gag-protease polyprotein n=1 Tax=Trifolium medium TaxID=97028 RepID=A0A392PAM4_9FABA|nr:gag-protease polyprotein [Trifolium medium]